jgi:hypothetical protein
MCVCRYVGMYACMYACMYSTFDISNFNGRIVNWAFEASLLPREQETRVRITPGHSGGVGQSYADIYLISKCTV